MKLIKKVRKKELLVVIPCYWCGFFTFNLGKVCTKCLNKGKQGVSNGSQ